APPAQASCQEGCLTSENTVLGDDALLNTTGGANTQSVLMRSLATQPAATTRPLVLLRSTSTPLAATTRPTVLVRLDKTQKAATTRPRVLTRSLATQP